MVELFVLLIIAGLLICWMFAARNYYKKGRIGHFFGHVTCCAVLVTIYWGLFVYPILNCLGYRCGIIEFLLFIGLSGGTILIWGIILLVYSSKHHSKNKLNFSEDNSIH